MVPRLCSVQTFKTGVYEDSFEELAPLEEVDTTTTFFFPLPFTSATFFFFFLTLTCSLALDSLILIPTPHRGGVTFITTRRVASLAFALLNGVAANEGPAASPLAEGSKKVSTSTGREIVASSAPTPLCLGGACNNGIAWEGDNYYEPGESNHAHLLEVLSLVSAVRKSNTLRSSALTYTLDWPTLGNF